MFFLLFPRLYIYFVVLSTVGVRNRGKEKTHFRERELKSRRTCVVLCCVVGFLRCVVLFEKGNEEGLGVCYSPKI